MKNSKNVRLVCWIIIYILTSWCEIAWLKGETGGGRHFITNYLPADYNSQPQNWCIRQDRRGIIYAANQEGLLTFDGVAWRAFNIPNRAVRSMALGEDGLIYIGGKNEIGFIKADHKGELLYHSLVHLLDAAKREFSTVWSTHAAPGGIYFRTSKLIIHYSFKTRSLNYRETGSVFFGCFVCGGQVYVQVRNAGLFRLTGDSLQKMPGCDVLNEEKIAALVPFPEPRNASPGRPNRVRLLAAMRYGRFFIYDGQTTVPFSTPAGQYIKQHQLYHASTLKFFPGQIALGTRWGGLVIMDRDGRVRRTIDKSSGLPDNNVRHVFEDNQGNIWLALTRGISKIENASPFELYGESSGLDGIVLSITREPLDNRLLVGTYTGLYSLDNTGRFHPLQGATGQYWHLLPLKNKILAATDRGVVEISAAARRKITAPSTFVLRESRIFPGSVWAGGTFGLALLGNNSGEWKELFRFSNIAEPVRCIEKIPGKGLWLGTMAAGVLKIDVHGDILKPVATVTRYGEKHGLPGGEVSITTAAGHVIFCTTKGIFRFDAPNNRFIPDDTLGEKFAGREDGIGVFRLVENKNGHIFFHSRFRHFHGAPETGKQGETRYRVDSTAFLRLPDEQANVIYPDPGESAVWFGTHEHVARYGTTFKKEYRRPFHTVIRRVVVNEKKNLYYGFVPPGAYDNPELEYRDRNLRFEYGATFFEGEKQTRYQYFLEGYDDGWSEWSPETHRVYTNLNSGSYTFRVRARSVYHHVGREAVFSFRVFPPWYKSWWAFMVYGLLIFVVIRLAFRWRSRKYRQVQQKLEEQVAERTKEIHEKNKQLEEIAERLEKKSQTLKEMADVKSCFLANISHEFRTPLSLIMGPIRHMMDNGLEPDQRKQLEMMSRNSQHLQNLIDQLLDLSRFESGHVKLRAVRQDIVVFLKGILEAFDLAARQKDLELKFSSDQEEMWLYFDNSKLEQVIGNLFFNIIKFVTGGGCVEVRVRSRDEGDTVELSVKVSGMGIPGEQLPHIFDRFYRMYTDEYRGNDASNIGMALAKELVNLHRGELEVRHLDEPGAEFIIRLPMGTGHLEPGEIVEQVVEQAPSRDTAETGAKKKAGLAQLAAAAVSTNGTAHDEDENNGNTGNGRSKKTIILIVDDSIDAREYMRRSLEPDYQVVEAVNGREAFEKAKKIIPDLVLSDVVMPETDGIDMCKDLKNDRKTSHIPVILLTARASEENILQGLESGADDYITKPFNSTLLKARIKNLIDLRRLFHLTLDREMTLQPLKIAVSDVDREFIEDLKKTIEKNMSNPDFNVEDLGKRLYMSRATLYRKIHALSGQSPTQFIRAYRLKRAAQLLTDKSKNVTDIAFSVGFSSTAYFTKCFKEKFHQLPSLYQLSQSRAAQPNAS